MGQVICTGLRAGLPRPLPPIYNHARFLVDSSPKKHLNIKQCLAGVGTQIDLDQHFTLDIETIYCHLKII